ncbi:MAG: Inner rane component of cytoplasmic domain [Pseudomonadota bacterium]|jgi:hypothetical protein
MTAPSAATRAVLRLAQGESSVRSWELVAASAHSTITVGAGADCNWIVQGEGVRSRHFALQWDGRRLLAADLNGAGGVTVRGEALTSAWREVQGASDIQFGSATISVAMEVAPETPGHPLDATAFGMPAQRPHVQRTAGAMTQFGVGAPLQLSPSADADSARKETLMGVAPINAESPSHAPSAPQGDAFRVIRPLGPSDKGKQASNRTNGMSGATHFGYVVEHPPSQPQSSSGADARPLQGALEVVEPPDGTVQVVPPPTAPAAPMPIMRSGTLIGVAVPEIVHALRKKTSGASLGDDDQRTIQGHVAPSGDGSRAVHTNAVQAMPPSVQPMPTSMPPGAFAGRGATLLQVSGPPSAPHASQPAVGVYAQPPAGGLQDSTQRIGSAWQESPHGDPSNFSSDSRPMGVLDSKPSMRDSRGSADATWTAPESGGTGRYAERARDSIPSTSRMERAGFPWRYLGIALLTVVAYFAWLYLLDHL